MLELRSVDAGYGSFQALFGVSLDVKAGEAVGVIGPNGAGKTTLMRVISGLIRPRNGSIAMEGTDVLATPAHRIVEPRHRPCAGEPAAVSAAHGRRQSEDGCVHARCARQIRRAAGIRLRSVSPHEGTARPDGGNHVGRRAADVRDRPRADVEPEAAAARRAVGGARAGRGAAGVRTGEADSRQRAHGADRRAERAAGAARRRSRLSARSRHHPRVGDVGGDDEHRQPSSRHISGYEHDPKKWAPVFREGHARKGELSRQCNPFSKSSTSICSKPWSTASCSAGCWRCWRSGSI